MPDDKMPLQITLDLGPSRAEPRHVRLAIVEEVNLARRRVPHEDDGNPG